MAYFDHNATTPLLPQARAAWLQAVDASWHNPSSPYRDAARAHRQLDECRSRIAGFFDLPPERVVFTSGATEAANAVMAWASAVLPAERGIWAGATEHPCVLEAARFHAGKRLRRLPVDASGALGAAVVKQQIGRGGAGLVAVMAANNETGVLADAGAVAEVCRAVGAWYLCDASQWIGKLPCASLPRAAFLIGCAHKFGGPKGVGFLCLPEGAEGFHSFRGGEHEHGHRAGTENLPAVAAMTAALEAAEGFDAGARRERGSWGDAFAGRITRAVGGAHVHGVNAERLWNTVSLVLPRHANTRWVARLDRAGFQVSTGSACATGSDAPSHVLAAMDVSAEAARRTIRVSSGWATTRAEWDALAAAIERVAAELREEETGAGAVIELPTA